ncbi:MAG: TAXI family TRAP transporter solute-binding subunit [Spirochaetaceae bacterium]|nr:TAXI family TRAP transporter solute-binding subunit [Spirochaetaceae bacterium]
MKKVIVLMLIVFISFGLLACQRGERIRFATGGTLGTYYPFGTAIATTLTEKTGISITVQSTGASRANIQLMQAGEVEMAIVQNDVMDYAWRGVDLFAADGQIRNFRVMAALYSEVCQIVVNPAAGIRTIADLRGKSVSVGDAGSGVEFNARQILAAHGLTFDDINRQTLGFGASADAFRDGRIDAFFVTAGAPTPAIVDLALGRDILILDISEASANQIIRSYPFYSRYTISAGTYNGINTDVLTVAVKATLIVHESLSEDTVYKMTRALFEYRSEIAVGHARGNDLNAAYAVEGIGNVPFHPGAARYFREIGVLR